MLQGHQRSFPQELEVGHRGWLEGVSLLAAEGQLVLQLSSFAVCVCVCVCGVCVCVCVCVVCMRVMHMQRLYIM